MPKRAASSTAGPAAKAAKRDPSIDAVAEALQRAAAVEVVDVAGAKLLELGLPGAVGTPAADRHESQKRVIGMIEEVLQKMKEHLQGVLDVATGKVADLEGAKGDLDSMAVAADEALTKAVEAAEASDAALAEATKQVKETEAEMKPKRANQKQLEKELEKLTKAQEAFTSCVDAHFKPLQSGDFGEEGADSHKKALLSVLTGAGVEESLLLSFPASCVKAVSERSSFDTMVFESVATALTQKQDAHAEAVAEQTATLAAALADIKAAEDQIETLKAAQASAEEALVQATTNQKEADAAATTATANKEGFEPNYAHAMSTKEECGVDLDNFAVFTFGCFGILRDGAEKAQKTPTEAEGTA